jgi:hypothetical protein
MHIIRGCIPKYSIPLLATYSNKLAHCIYSSETTAFIALKSCSTRCRGHKLRGRFFNSYVSIIIISRCVPDTFGKITQASMQGKLPAAGQTSYTSRTRATI